MAKNRLAAEGYFDFHLIGLVSTAREYKVAWALNEALGFAMIKSDDLKIEFARNIIIKISNYLEKSEHKEIMLLKNRLVSRSNSSHQYLIEELKQFDYLMKIKDETGQTDFHQLLSFVKTVEVIDYAANLEPDLIKSRDNLIF